MFELPFSEITVQLQPGQYAHLRWFINRLEIQRALIEPDCPEVIYFIDAPEVRAVFNGLAWSIRDIYHLLVPPEDMDYIA